VVVVVVNMTHLPPHICQGHLVICDSVTFGSFSSHVSLLCPSAQTGSRTHGPPALSVTSLQIQNVAILSAKGILWFKIQYSVRDVRLREVC
jgi:hypothetical protein